MKFIFLALLSLSVLICSAQIDLLKVASNKSDILLSPSVSIDEIAEGLKEALVIGANKSIKSASVKNGFYSNKFIRIPFPSNSEKMKKSLQKAGMQSQIKAFEKSINSAAELASKELLIIFIDVIKIMSIQDGLKILNGGNSAATYYLRKQTTDQLYIKIKPIIMNAIKESEVAKYWTPLVKTYNSIPFTKSVNPDLEDYITNKTIEGIFVLIANQEKEIRMNPKSRTSLLLQKVFN